MSELDIRLEILSALTNCTVKPQEPGGSPSNDQSLTIENYLPTVLCTSTKTGAFTSILKGFQNFLTPKNIKQEKEPERVLFVDLEEFFDPKYDFDFGEFDETSDCSRGCEPYRRPWGYKRFALKVLDKYPDGNDWLGPNGLRKHSAPGEWPVSFHGTDIEGAKGITGSNYHVGKGAVYGRGIYSTPDIEIAEKYSMSLTCKSKINGKTYTVIMQNRINPDKRIKIKEVKDYWLISVPEGTTPEEEIGIVESCIRPYGILIKEDKSAPPTSRKCQVI